MAEYCVREVSQHVALLPFAGLCDGEQAGSGDFAVAAAVAETDLAPLDSRAQDPLCYVVGRLHSFLFQECEVEGKCQRFYAAIMGRPGLAPGIYFRLLLVGYFEGIDSERGIAWRAGDSLSIRAFVGIPLDEGAPDHTTISRTRRLIDVETHRDVFGWVLGLLADAGLVKGKRIGIDATTLEANAALRSIVRRDNGQSYEEFLQGLAQQAGIATPTREDLARVDRKRKKKGSNQE